MPKARNRKQDRRKTQVSPPKPGMLDRLRSVAIVCVAIAAFVGVSWLLVDKGPGSSILTDEEVFLKEDGDLPDVVMGRRSAPVTIVEYASMGCSHCGAFARNAFPEVKRRLIDTGIARYVFREFPLDTVSLGAAMLPRCVPEADYHRAVKALYDAQEKWLSSSERSNVLFETMQPFGMTRARFDECLGDDGLEDRIAASRRRGSDLGVESTPTFIVGGVRYQGSMSAAQIEEIVRTQKARATAAPG